MRTALYALRSARVPAHSPVASGRPVAPSARRMAHRAVALSALLLSFLSASFVGCGGGASTSAGPICTEIGCADQVTIRVDLSPEEAAAGRHEFVIDADGTTITCTLEHTDTSAVDHATCDGGASVFLGARTEMVEMESPVPGTVMAGARAVPGAFEMVIEVYGRPARVRVVHTLDGVTLRDETATPSYAATYPNGANCEPVCQQASVTWARRP